MNGEKRNTYISEQAGRKETDRKVKMDVEKWNGVNGLGLFWLRVGTSGGLL
jgi:hypothetical protein